jgi:hypothetical protein
MNLKGSRMKVSWSNDMTCRQFPRGCITYKRLGRTVGEEEINLEGGEDARATAKRRKILMNIYMAVATRFRMFFYLSK